MTLPYPIPRQLRQSDIIVGDGGAIYGPFNFKVFDTDDVEVWTQALGEVKFSQVSVVVAKGANPFDDFTVTFPANQPATTKIVVRSKRLDERSAGVMKGTSIDPTALEKEFSKISTETQELRRDIDRSIKSDFGQPAYTIDTNLENGAVLMVSGDRLVKGPEADDILHAEENAEIATAAAAAAQAVANAGYLFATEAAFVAANIPAVVQIVQTKGYYAIGDGGGHLKRKIAMPGAPTAWQKQSADGAWWQISEFIPTLEMFGAKGDAATNDTTARDNAVAYVGKSGTINLLPKKTYLVSSYNNVDGIKYLGDGSLVTAVASGGQWQRNNYADPRRLHLGHEYLDRVYEYMNLGQGNGSGTFKVRIYGDSTATDGYGDNGPTTVFSRGLVARGIPNHVMFNQAVSGTRWDQFAGLADVANTDLMIISYGVNDPANGVDMDSRLAALAANMDAKLSAIRAATGGGVGVLSIIIKGPNSTSDSPNNRDERWYERIRNIYVAMARKYQCAYYDTYGQYPDSRGAANLWMDDPFGDGRSLHPARQMNNWVWGRLLDEFFPVGAVAMHSANRVANNGATTSNLTPGTLPSAFKDAFAIYRATAANGWPMDGFVVVTRNVDSGVMQTLYNYANGNTKVMIRTAYISGDSWNPWSGQAVSLTSALTASWVNYGGAYAAPSITRLAEGVGILNGAIAGGTTTVSTVFCTLPVNYRPATNVQRIVNGNGSPVGILINASTGAMSFQTAGNATLTDLNGATFLLA